MLSSGANFFSCVKSVVNNDNVQSWNPCSMYPDKNEKEISELYADYFNGISSEYEAADKKNTPTSYNSPIDPPTPEQVAEEIRKGKKPTSRVKGDIFVNVLVKCLDTLSKPISQIYDRIIREKTWPSQWLVEYVTIIPKNQCPETPAECRNISCTNYLSKVFERFVLKWARQQVLPKLNQYGGEKGCSTEHFLIDIWDQITDSLEDQRAAAVLTDIDYSKAFNRLEHSAVLEQFKQAGASTEILALLASFLIGRRMTVKTGSAWSEPRTVNAGAPQGSVLGTYIFNIDTDKLEDHFTHGTPEEHGYEIQENDLAFLETQSQSAWQSSTPLRQQPDTNPLTQPVGITPVRGTQRIELLPRVRNAPTSRRIEPSWRHKQIKVRKYVDDNLQGEKLKMKAGITFERDGEAYKNVRAVESERLFQHIARAAERQGLQVNTKKTALLAISGARSYKAKTHIYDQNNCRIDSVQSLKILGFIFNDQGTVSHQISSLTKKFIMRVWTLRKLANCGFSEEERLQVYKTMLRPVLEYSSVIYHPMLSEEQENHLEKLQTRALKNIYGHIYSARQLLEISKLDTLAQRRQKACEKFANKLASSERFSNWLPKKGTRSRNKSYEQYIEYPARTDRRRNSPLFYIRRLLNTNRVNYDIGAK